MRSPFDRHPEQTIRETIEAAWQLKITSLRYFPEGGGAYHWIADAEDGQQWFVTCDDLDSKPWLGDGRATVLDGLRAAYATAVKLRGAGMAFVAAATPAASGALVEPLDDRHSLSVFEYVHGEPGQWGRTPVREVRTTLVDMLARLHQAAPPKSAGLARCGYEVPGRRVLDEALDELDKPWDGGPLSEAARQALAEHADVVESWLAHLDRFGAAAGQDGLVLTHGEPHPGNLIFTAEGPVLVDWDTVAIARPERDLWMIAGAEVEAAYRNLTGTALDPRALHAHRLLWALRDIAAFTQHLRAEHRQDADAEKSFAGLTAILDGREPAPYRLAE